MDRSALSCVWDEVGVDLRARLVRPIELNIA